MQGNVLVQLLALGTTVAACWYLFRSLAPSMKTPLAKRTRRATRKRYRPTRGGTAGQNGVNSELMKLRVKETKLATELRLVRAQLRDGSKSF